MDARHDGVHNKAVKIVVALYLAVVSGVSATLVETKLTAAVDQEVIATSSSISSTVMAMKMKKMRMKQMGGPKMSHKGSNDKKEKAPPSSRTMGGYKMHSEVPNGKGSTLKSAKKMDSSKSSMQKDKLHKPKSPKGKGMYMMMGKGKGKGKGVTTIPSSAPSGGVPPVATVEPTEVVTVEPTMTPTQFPVSFPTQLPTVGPTFSPAVPAAEPPLFCFNIDDETCGPNTWPDIDIPDNQCGGSRNSPIAITSNSFCEPVDYVFNAGSCTYGDLEYVVNEYSISAVYPERCTPPSVIIGDLTYRVDSWSYSLGTGHSLDDEATFGAVQILHSLVDGDEFAQPFAMIGIGSILGTPDPFVDRVINGFIDGYYQSAEDCDTSRDPVFEGSETPDEIASPYTMLPVPRRFYQYLGSRTVPPCQEEIFWNYASVYTSIDDAQADTIRNLILNWIDPDTCRLGTVADPDTGSTSRPPLDPGDRPISLTGDCASA